jgi:FkbM family methyltransferase
MLHDLRLSQCRAELMWSIIRTLRFIASHPLTSNQRLRGIWRYGRWQVESRLRREIEVDWIDGSKLVARRGMTGATGNIYCGLHEFAEMAFLLHLLQPDDLFVDVGANVGSYTILASAVCRARSISVEPDPDAILSLVRNTVANGIQHRVRLVQAALGAESTSAQFTVGLDTTNRITNDRDVPTRKVQVMRLDDLLNGLDPCLVKMDVEGYEAEVLAGAETTLRNPSLLCVQTETIEDRIVTRLGAAGFKPMFYDPQTRRLSPALHRSSSIPTNNTLFVRDLRACEQRIATAPARLICGTWV